MIIQRETKKEERAKQNEFIKELDPLIFSLHLGSMKIFFQNIETEEKTVDGEVLGELDQVCTDAYKIIHLPNYTDSIKINCPGHNIRSISMY